MVSTTPRGGDSTHLAMQVKEPVILFLTSKDSYLRTISLRTACSQYHNLIYFQLLIANQNASRRELQGMARLLQGTREIGVLLIGDNGYGYDIPEYLAEEGALTPQQYCDKVGLCYFFHSMRRLTRA